MMKMNEAPKSVLDLLIKEADAYNSSTLLETALKKGESLKNWPLQPLYLALKTLSPEELSTALPLLSKKQRTVLLDLDLWDKDKVDFSHFETWVLAYGASNKDELRVEFAGSQEFLLYLKGRFNIWTFDAEEPEYPEHDRYFLTDDSLLLFEFDETYPHIDMVQRLVRDLYGEMGVENAYTFLFKMVSDSYSSLSEEEFELKKKRLEEYGFVDYYDALILISPFKNEEHLKLNILKKSQKQTPELDIDKKLQALTHASITHFKNDFELMTSELLKIKSQDRINFLKFNFVKLTNATLALTGTLKEGSVAISKISESTRNFLNLGLSYILRYKESHQENHKETKEYTLFEQYDFYDLYKVGFNLIRFVQNDIKKSLREFDFENERESFLGEYYLDFLDNAFLEIPYVLGKRVSDYETYQTFQKLNRGFKSILPFARSFRDMIHKLDSEGVILDEFYINYTIVEIDLEAILLSSFIHFSLGLLGLSGGLSEGPPVHSSSLKKNKMGLTIDEFRDFINKFPFLEDESVEIQYFGDKLSQEIADFCESFGLKDIPDINGYLKILMKKHLSGYDFNNLVFEDFKHVGGPIILKALSQ